MQMTVPLDFKAVAKQVGDSSALCLWALLQVINRQDPFTTQYKMYLFWFYF